ncbi:hypothetical protein LCGC14_3060280 [marine sediment metagenome]|uniref:Sulfotransferase domain-containing protein n=1 Tax=marine sediment metagenome TaxID=412755 RepID=A0A0F8WJ31_9ZZZZ
MLAEVEVSQWLTFSSYFIVLKRIEVYERDGKPIYGETNPFWATNGQMDGLMLAVKDAVYLHLVRDGRKVVASVYTKCRHYSDRPFREPHTRILPVKNFKELSRFEKICWYWRYYNEEIEKRVKSRVRLEDIQILLEKLDQKGRPFYELEWDDEKEKQFQKICGETMKHYGYD